ncbi:MAG: hypothetical protein GX273_04530 [Bacteroidales bacterium]|nr:hypothetical protein [Bacteroidales bacterium]
MTEEQANIIIGNLQELLQSNYELLEEFIKRVQNIEHALRFFEWVGAVILVYLVVKFLWWVFSNLFFGGV